MLFIHHHHWVVVVIDKSISACELTRAHLTTRIVCVTWQENIYGLLPPSRYSRIQVRDRQRQDKEILRLSWWHFFSEVYGTYCRLQEPQNAELCWWWPTAIKGRQCVMVHNWIVGHIPIFIFISTTKGQKDATKKKEHLKWSRLSFDLRLWTTIDLYWQCC